MVINVVINVTALYCDDSYLLIRFCTVIIWTIDNSWVSRFHYVQWSSGRQTNWAAVNWAKTPCDWTTKFRVELWPVLDLKIIIFVSQMTIVQLSRCRGDRFHSWDFLVLVTRWTVMCRALCNDVDLIWLISWLVFSCWWWHCLQRDTVWDWLLTNAAVYQWKATVIWVNFWHLLPRWSSGLYVQSSGLSATLLCSLLTKQFPMVSLPMTTFSTMRTFFHEIAYYIFICRIILAAFYCCILSYVSECTLTLANKWFCY